MGRLQEGQERCFGIFREHAGTAVLTMWDRALTAKTSLDLTQLRQIAARTSAEQQVTGHLAEIWFDTCTRRIDGMREVETLLAQDLLHVCRQSISRARADLESRRMLSRRLSNLPDNSTTVLFSVQASTFGDPLPEGISPELSRSVLDRVYEQGLRLKQLDEELATTRAVLEERHQIELAKRRLESELGLSEKAAHERLQRISMETGSRLADVAAKILS